MTRVVSHYIIQRSQQINVSLSFRLTDVLEHIDYILALFSFLFCVSAKVVIRIKYLIRLLTEWTDDVTFLSVSYRLTVYTAICSILNSCSVRK